MKKQLLSLLACFASLSSMSQSLYLAGYESHDDIEQCVYVYNDIDKVSEIRRFDSREPNMNYIVVVTYNDLGQEVRSDVYQDMKVTGSDDYRDYVYVAYVEYTYDDNGMLAERINYNNWGASQGKEDWSMGGVMTYSYDDAGRLESVKTYFSLDKSELFQEEKHEYSENGMLERKLIYVLDFFAGEMGLESRIEYLYDSEGRIQIIDEYYKSWETGELELGATTEYGYNEDGSLAEVTKLNGSDVIQQKNEYSYSADAIPASDVIFPYEHEELDTNSLYPIFTLAPDSYDFYALTDDDNFSYIATYYYEYSEVSGILRPEVGNRADGVELVSFSDNRLVMDGVPEGSRVRIFGQDGRCVAETNYSSDGVDMTNMDKGVYIVSVQGRALKIRK